MPRYNIIVSGRVQGVGFRYFVQALAKKLDLKGWVKNLDNGNVQMELQTKEDNLDLIIDKLKKGNGFSKISDLKIKVVEEVDNNNNFKILY